MQLLYFRAFFRNGFSPDNRVAIDLSHLFCNVFISSLNCRLYRSWFVYQQRSISKRIAVNG